MDLKQELTKNDIQSFLRLSELLSDLSNGFKTYHFTIVDQLQDDEEAVSVQGVLEDHKLKLMEFIDCIEELAAEPSQTKEGLDHPIPRLGDLAQATMQGQTVDVQLDITDGSVTTIKRDLENPGVVDVHVLINYMDKVKYLEGI